MTLLITVFAAIVCTVIWYKNAPNDRMKTSTLCLMFWGASLMWLVDAVVEYLEIGEEFFTPTLEDIINDLYLGLCVVALGLVIWLVILLFKDPEGKLKALLSKSK